MRKSLGLGLTAAAVIATGLLTPAAGWAAVTATSAGTSALAGPGGDPDTTVTFSVTTGALSMTAPDTADLGSGAPGTTITGALGAVTVTDDRATLGGTWAATAAATDFTTGAGTPDETIPATDAAYTPGAITTTGRVTATGTPVRLDSTAQTVVAGTAAVGNNTASWDPTIAVDVPADSVTGVYTATLTQSVA